MEIALACDHGSQCLAMAESLMETWRSPQYAGQRMATLELSGQFDWYLDAHRTARRRSLRALRLGYEFCAINPECFVDDIFEINMSSPERQGKPMTERYTERPTFDPPPVIACSRHHVYRYGVFNRDTLVAYLWLHRCGELALVSSILGHAQHLENNIMYLLVTRAIEAQLGLGGVLVYNRYRSGTAGLRFFKDRIGFSPTEVAWKL